MKKSLIFIFIFSFFCFFPFLDARADLGPKRTLDVEVIGVDVPYHIELLTPGTLPTGEELEEKRNLIEQLTPNYPEFLFSFESNGYISANLKLAWGTKEQKINDHYFIYSYNPPQDIKVMLIFEDDHYVLSKPIETTLFNSKVTFDLTYVDYSINQSYVSTIKEVFPVQTMTLDLVLRIIGTIFIEILVLFLFAYTHKFSYKLIIIVNSVSQILLTLFMFTAKYFIFPVIGEIFVLIVGEIMIFLTEIIIYRFYLTEKTKKRAMLYGLIANIISLAASYSVMILMMNS